MSIPMFSPIFLYKCFLLFSTQETLYFNYSRFLKFVNSFLQKCEHLFDCVKVFNLSFIYLSSVFNLLHWSVLVTLFYYMNKCSERREIILWLQKALLCFRLKGFFRQAVNIIYYILYLRSFFNLLFLFFIKSSSIPLLGCKCGKVISIS